MSRATAITITVGNRPPNEQDQFQTDSHRLLSEDHTERAETQQTNPDLLLGCFGSKEYQYDSADLGTPVCQTYNGDDALRGAECGTPAVRRW